MTDHRSAPGHPIARIRHTTTQPTPAQRRWIGLALGGLLGLTYGLVAQTINRFTLPGVPLYQPPLGPAGNTLLSGLTGAGLGLLVTLPMSSALGIVLGSAAVALAIMTSSLIRLAGELTAGAGVVFGVLLSVPLSWFAVPLVALLRWAIDRQAVLQLHGESRGVRWRVPLILMLLMGFVAAFELLGTNAQAQLRQMDRTVEAGLAAAAVADLPEPLRDPLVHDFPAGRSQAYTLEWTQQDLDRFIELRPAANYDEHAAVIARFADGYRLVCLYPTARSGPTCGTY